MGDGTPSPSIANLGYVIKSLLVCSVCTLIKKLQFYFQEEVYNMLEAENVGIRLMD
jgi:hypothetical protein